MLIVFFDVHEIVHLEFMPQGQTINQNVYKDILRRLMCSVREKRRELWETKSCLLHHDNAPAHNALSIRQFVAENNIAVLEQPPYSPDLAPCDFFLFPKLKRVINPLNPTFPHLKALRPEISSQKFSKKIIFFFFSFWDYESPAALKPTSKSV